MRGRPNGAMISQATKNYSFVKKSLLHTAFFFGIEKQMICIHLFLVNKNFC